MSQHSTDCGDPAIRVMTMPRDTNAQGTIFGGVILSYIDQAGAIEARKHAPHLVVTVAMDKVDFKEPVYVGDVLTFCTQTMSIGRSSIRVRVTVFADRWHPRAQRVQVTVAEVTYVAVGEDRRPIPVPRP